MPTSTTTKRLPQSYTGIEPWYMIKAQGLVSGDFVSLRFEGAGGVTYAEFEVESVQPQAELVAVRSWDGLEKLVPQDMLALILLEEDETRCKLEGSRVFTSASVTAEDQCSYCTCMAEMREAGS